MAKKKIETAETVKEETAAQEKKSAVVESEKPTPESLRSEAEALCLDYNDAFRSADYAKAKDTRDSIDEKVKDYNGLMRKACYKTLISSDDPMLEAIKQMQYPIIRVKTDKSDDEVPTICIADSQRYIDLADLHNRAESYQRKNHLPVVGIGHDKNWNAYLQKMNMCMTIRQAQRIIKDKDHLTAALHEIDSSYAMSNAAKEIELGKTPTSNTQLLKTLQTMIDAMVGPEYKAISHDVNVLCDTYAQFDKRSKLKVLCSKHGNFRRIMMNICNSIVTGNDYGVVFDKKKEK